MAQRSRQTQQLPARAGRVGLTLLALVSAVGPLSACTGWSTPSVAASLACSGGIQGKEGGGSEYLDCLRVYGALEAAHRSSG
jgi:hypothetical protein